MGKALKTTGIVSGDVRPLPLRLRQWVVPGVVACVVVGCSIAGALYLWPDKQQPPAVQTQPTEQSESRRIGSAAQAYKYTGDMDKAEQVLLQALAKSPDDQDTEYYLMQLGALYETKQSHAQALEKYKQAEALPQPTTKGVAQGIARCSEKLGNKTVAIEYYRQAYKLVDPRNQGSTQDKQYFEQRIKSLGGTL